MMLYNKIYCRDAEPLCRNCSMVLVWHTQTRRVDTIKKVNTSKFRNTNIEILMKEIL